MYNVLSIGYNTTVSNARVAQLVERRAYTSVVGGSSPSARTLFKMNITPLFYSYSMFTKLIFLLIILFSKMFFFLYLSGGKHEIYSNTFVLVDFL